MHREGIVTDEEIEVRTPEKKGDGDWSGLAPLEAGWQGNIAALEKSMVERALRQAEGNKSRAAEILGIHRRLLYEKMREHNLE